MREILFAFLGWCLGILGSGVSERIQRTNRRADMVRSVSAELCELQYTLVAVAWKLRSHLGTATDGFVDWSLPIIKSYNGPSKSPTLADAIAASRQFTEAQRRQADLQARGPNMGLSLKTYKMAFVDSAGAELSICEVDFQRRVFRVKEQLDLFNQETQFLQGQFDKTFETGITPDNRRNVDRNLESGYAKLADSAQRIATYISEIVSKS